MDFKLKKAETIFDIKIGSIERGHELVKIANSYKEDIDVFIDRYVVDAKSILGVFSLSWNKPLRISIKTNDDTIIARFEQDIKEYMEDIK